MKNLAIATTLIFLVACQPQTKKKILPKEEPVEVKVRRDTTYFTFSNETASTTSNLKSKLQIKVDRLIDNDATYSIDKIGIIKDESSIVYKGVMGKPESCRTKKKCYKISDIDQFKSSIHEINYVKVDEEVEDKESRNSKIIIEELTFYSESDAVVLFDYINHVRDVEYFWNTIDRYRSDMFRESNKLYFISKQNQHAHRKGEPMKITDLIKA